MAQYDVHFVAEVVCNSTDVKYKTKCATEDKQKNIIKWGGRPEISLIKLKTKSNFQGFTKVCVNRFADYTS